MRVRLSLLGGQLLDFEIDTTAPSDDKPLPFGFTSTAGAQVEMAEDRDPLADPS